MENAAKALALGADQVGGGHHHSVEKHFVGVDRVSAHLVDHADGDMATIEIRVEQAQSMGLALDLLERRGAGEDQYLVGDLRRGYPDLLPRQDIAIAAAVGPDLDGGGVESGIRLGHGKTSLVLAGDQ